MGNLLGQENQGFQYLMQELAQERLVVAVRAAASIETFLQKTIDYTRERKAFGQSVFELQNTRFKLAEAKARGPHLWRQRRNHEGNHRPHAVSAVSAPPHRGASRLMAPAGAAAA
ncbi:hypothetical protein LVC68_00490 [Melaminivora jejuensis]|nr:acyl-CoA dehydrogenase family protein [Melaminivora jejuensis]UHJ65049.1 hypothetical protein LVC68_00490 [Melaminivora jejuensis]